eukprot:727035_1
MNSVHESNIGIGGNTRERTNVRRLISIMTLNSHLKAQLKEQPVKYIKKAKELFSNGLLEDAASLVSRAIFLSPSESCFYVFRGDIYVKLCDFNSAILNYRKALKLRPKNVGIRHRLSKMHASMGSICMDKGDLDNAEMSFAEAVYLSPKSEEFLIKRATCLTSMARFYDAIECLTTFLRREYRVGKNLDVSVLIMRSEVFLEVGKIELAYGDFCRAQKMDPKNASV